MSFTPHAETLEDPRNLHELAAAHRRKAMEAAATSRLHADRNDLVAARRFGDDAEQLYARANALHKKAYETRTRAQKAKPWIHNGIIATVLAAEVISIPILLANIGVMCKHRSPHAATL